MQEGPAIFVAYLKSKNVPTESGRHKISTTLPLIGSGDNRQCFLVFFLLILN